MFTRLKNFIWDVLYYLNPFNWDVVWLILSIIIIIIYFYIYDPY